MRHIVRALVPVEKKLAQIYPNNPNFWRGRLSNSAGQVRIPMLKHNSNDVPLTYAGHALEKHGNRKLPSPTFPIPTGTNANKNRLAQEIVDSILFVEATIVIKRPPTLKEKGRDASIKYFIEVQADYGKGPGLIYKNGSSFQGLNMKALDMRFFTDDDEKIRANIRTDDPTVVIAEIEKLESDKFLLYFSEFAAETEVNAEEFLQLLQQAIERLRPTI